MLTSDLLVTKISKGRIEPIFALLNPENLAVAGSVIDIFRDHVGMTYGELIGGAGESRRGQLSADTGTGPAIGEEMLNWPGVGH